MTKLEKALQQYMEAFDENYPLIATMEMNLTHQ